jgi:hypothetical protein
MSQATIEVNMGSKVSAHGHKWGHFPYRDVVCEYLEKRTKDMGIGREIVIQVVAANVIFVVVKAAQHFQLK